MKKNIIIYPALMLLMACGAKENKDKSAANTTSQQNALNQVVGIGKIEPENEIIQLSSAAAGIVQKIWKKENDSVSAGTIILELDHQVQDAQIMQITQQIKSQEAQIKADEASVEEYTARVANATTDLKRLQSLLQKGAETQQNIDNANTNLQTNKATLKKLLANVDNAKSRLGEIKASEKVAMAERDQKIIRSPVKGRILEISTLIGGSVDTRQSFVQICPDGKTIAVCEIDEMYAEKVKIGQKVKIRTVGAADAIATGTVYFMADFLKKKSLFTDQSGEKEDRRVRTVKILLDQPDKLLLNARVECVIDMSGNTDK